jgi:hypothetical protein
VLSAHNCSSTRQTNREPTHAAERAFITSHSWSRAERSSDKHINGHVHARPSSWTNRASSLSTGNTVLRPTGLILMDSSSRRSATRPRKASRRGRELGAPRRPPRGRLRSRRPSQAHAPAPARARTRRAPARAPRRRSTPNRGSSKSHSGRSGSLIGRWWRSADSRRRTRPTSSPRRRRPARARRRSRPSPSGSGRGPGTRGRPEARRKSHGCTGSRPG